MSNPFRPDHADYGASANENAGSTTPKLSGNASATSNPSIPPRPRSKTRKAAFTPPAEPSLMATNNIHSPSMGLQDDTGVTPLSFDTTDPVIGVGQTRLQGGSLDTVGRDSGATPAVTTGGVLSPFTNAPPNPFSRTLASMEEQHRSGGGEEAPVDIREGGTESRPTAKAAMDVDAFKDMLMTGKTPEKYSAGGTNAKAAPASEDSSDEEIEHMKTAPQQTTLPRNENELHGASPRPSYENYDRELLQDANETEAQKTSRPKPPPPRHRHGKAVTPASTANRPLGPRTVSFDDFAPTISDTKDVNVARPVNLSRRSSGAPKPLPPTPQPAALVTHSSQLTTDDESNSVRSSAVSSPSLGPTTAGVKRMPPAVPLARRQSQQSTFSASNRSRSGTTSSLIEHDEREPSPGDMTRQIEIGTPAKMVPPPPPARRSGTLPPDPSAQLTSPSTGSLQRALAAAAPSRERSASQNSLGSSHAPPPPPPRRTSSRSSIDAPRPTHLVQSSLNPQQPGGSRRTSSEMRRSGEFERRVSMSSGTQRGPSISEVEESGDGGEARAGSKDILADMDAFQREIDDLLRKNSKDSGRREEV